MSSAFAFPLDGSAPADTTSPDYVLAGTRCTYVANWNETGVLVWTSGVQDLLGQISAALQNQYQLKVESSQVQAPAVAVGSLTETITLKLYSGQDRNSINDIQGNVDDLFAQLAARPDSSAISSVTPPGGSAQNTGAPAAPGQPGSSPSLGGNDQSSGGGAFSSWWDKLTTQVEAGSIGLVVGAAAVIGLIVFLAVRNETGA